MRATLLLPAARRFGSYRPSPRVARLLGRADRAPNGREGRRAQLLRHFDLLPAHWPVAALTRQADAGDAAGAAWLRADPCHVLPDINGARLLACGGSMGMTADDAAALLPALRPLFGDAGCPIDAPEPSRWYLRLPASSPLPAFSEPDDALGADVFEHTVEGPEGRRWRALLSEAQVVLHNHPWNARRMAQGRPPVNSLWFWGGGLLPDRVRSDAERVHADETVARALAAAAGNAVPLPARFPAADGAGVFDLTALRDPAALERDWLLPALDALSAGTLRTLALDSEDGLALTLARAHRWRVWRRPATGLDA